MRYSEIIEGEVVDLGAHRFGRAVDEYSSTIQQIVKSSADHFGKGTKFIPFAQSYIESGYDREYLPEFFIDVQFRDYRPAPEARAVLDEMKKQRWEIIRTKYSKDYQVTKEGPLARKDNLSFDEVRAIWENRENSKYGAYQKSRHGFRSSRLDTYDERGLGFSLLVMGLDARREQYGKPSEEYHIIDDEQDWAEVVEMMALIRRSKIK